MTFEHLSRLRINAVLGISGLLPSLPWLAGVGLAASFPQLLVSAPVGEKMRLVDGILYQGKYETTTYAPGSDQFLEYDGTWEALVSGADVKITFENDRKVISLIGEDQFTLVTRGDNGFQEGEIRRRSPETIIGDNVRTAQFILHRLREIDGPESGLSETYALSWNHLTETVDAAIPEGVTVQQKAAGTGLVDQWYVNAYRRERADGSVESESVPGYPADGFLALEYPVQNGPLKPDETLLVKEYWPKSRSPDGLRATDDCYLFRETTLTFQGHRAVTDMNLLPTVTFDPVSVTDYRFRSGASGEPGVFEFDETYWVATDNSVGFAMLSAIMTGARVTDAVRDDRNRLWIGTAVLCFFALVGFLLLMLTLRKREAKAE